MPWRIKNLPPGNGFQAIHALFVHAKAWMRPCPLCHGRHKARQDRLELCPSLFEALDRAQADADGLFK